MYLNRRSFIAGVASGAIAGVLGSYGLNFQKKPMNGSAKKTQRPNIVLLLADDMRWDAMGVVGNQTIHTPNLDALAAEGTLFTNNFVTTSICPSSRASILTGQYARRHGIWDFFSPLRNEQFLLSYPSLVRRTGYQTAFLGKWGIGGPLPQSEFDYWRGFEGQGHYFDPSGNRGEHLTRFLSRQASEFLETIDDHKPFCLSISFKAPHGPFNSDPKFSHLYKNVLIPHPPTGTEEHFERLPGFLRDSLGRDEWEWSFSSDERYQNSIKQYYRLITGLDDAVGTLVALLKKMQVYDNTYVVFTSDNGFLLGEHGLVGKWWGHEESIRTPLIIKPIEQPVVSRIDAMTLNIDLYPTLLELAGVLLPGEAQGISLVPLLTGATTKTRDIWFYEHLFEHPKIPKTEGIRTDRYKYLRYLDTQEEGEYLFDLHHDPYEEHNLVGQTAHQSLLEFMRKKIRKMQIDVA